MKLPKRRKRPAPRWVRAFENGYAQPGWVQVKALPAISRGKTDLDAAKRVSSTYLYVFTNSHGDPAATLAIDVGPDWLFEGVIVPAEKAYAAGLLTERQLARCLRSWT